MKVKEKAEKYANDNCVMPDENGEPEQCQYTFEVAKNAYLSGYREALKNAAEEAERKIGIMLLGSDIEKVERCKAKVSEAILAMGEDTEKCPPHSWDRSGERCTKCGDKDWMT